MIVNFDSMYLMQDLYNVLNHSHWGLGQLSVGGGICSEKKGSLQILDL